MGTNVFNKTAKSNVIWSKFNGISVCDANIVPVLRFIPFQNKKMKIL
jgi:hypothetical protein